MAENQKNPRDLDENLNQRKDQDRTEDQRNQGQQRTGTGSAQNERKTPVSSDDEDSEDREREEDTSREGGVNPQQGPDKTGKSQSGQQERKSGTERRDDSV